MALMHAATDDEAQILREVFGNEVREATWYDVDYPGEGSGHWAQVIARDAEGAIIKVVKPGNDTMPLLADIAEGRDQSVKFIISIPAPEPETTPKAMTTFVLDEQAARAWAVSMVAAYEAWTEGGHPGAGMPAIEVGENWRIVDGQYDVQDLWDGAVQAEVVSGPDAEVYAEWDAQEDSDFLSLNLRLRFTCRGHDRRVSLLTAGQEPRKIDDPGVEGADAMVAFLGWAVACLNEALGDLDDYAATRAAGSPA